MRVALRVLLLGFDVRRGAELPEWYLPGCAVERHRPGMLEELGLPERHLSARRGWERLHDDVQFGG